MEEGITYQSTDGIILSGVLNKQSDNNKIVVLCHGFNSGKDRSVGRIAGKISSERINTFRFDFRSHGESSRAKKGMTITGELEDLKSTLKLLKNLGYKEFILLGFSFGGGIVSLLDNDEYKNVKGIGLWYSVLDYNAVKDTLNVMIKENNIDNKEFVEVNGTNGKNLRISKEILSEMERYKPYKNIEALNIPILLVHGTKDEMVPYTISEKVVKILKNAKLITIDGGIHTFKDSETSMEIAISKTIEYLKEVMYSK